MSEDKLSLLKMQLQYEAKIDLAALGAMIEERLKGIPIFGDLLAFKEAQANIIEINGLNRAIEILSESVSKLEQNNKLDQNYIQNCQREIYFIFKFFLNAIYNQPNEDFIGFLSHYVCNCINEDFSNVKVKVNILNRVSKYTKQHIEVLKAIYDDCIENGWPENLKNDNYNNVDQIKKIRGIEPFIINFCFNDLKNDGFLFQSIGMFNNNTYSPYEITEMGVQCLKMLDIKL